MKTVDRLIESCLSFANFAANGSIGAAANTVDIASGVVITQTTPNIVLTLPAPTGSNVGHKFLVVNDGTVAVTVSGELIPAGQSRDFVLGAGVWCPKSKASYISEGPTTIVGAQIPNTSITPATGIAVTSLTLPFIGNWVIYSRMSAVRQTNAGGGWAAYGLFTAADVLIPDSERRIFEWPQIGDAIIGNNSSHIVNAAAVNTVINVKAWKGGGGIVTYLNSPSGRALFVYRFIG